MIQIVLLEILTQTSKMLSYFSIKIKNKYAFESKQWCYNFNNIYLTVNLTKGGEIKTFQAWKNYFSKAFCSELSVILVYLVD